MEPRAAVVEILSRVLAALPPRMAIRVGRWAGRHFLRRFLKPHIIRENQRNAFGHDDPALLATVLESFGGIAASIPHLRNILEGRRGASLTVLGAENLPPGATIFVGAHVKNWEVGTLAMVKAARPALFVYSALSRPWADALLQRLRCAAADSLAFVEKDKALRACITHLQNGGSLGLVIDQRTDSGHHVEFFGRKARFTHMPARLALRFNCPIIPLQGVGDDADAQFVVRFLQPILPQGKTELQITREMAGAIEGIIAQDPGECFCNKRRWPKEKKK
ncbi:MAG: lysophospholipid acyltransferase family protein [Aestuariivirgaceae bacterium]|nr:lysophospholipid acyltransferase family protein [Aestuariivirgaceae bacterium]